MQSPQPIGLDSDPRPRAQARTHLAIVPKMVSPEREPQAISRQSGTGAADWSDAEFRSRLLHNQPLAWREFVHRYERLIMSCIRKVTRRFEARLSSADHEDIYAMMLCRITSKDMHQLRVFEPDSGVRLSTWVGLLASNAAYDFLRGLAREQRAQPRLRQEEVRPMAEDPAAVLEAKELWRMILEHSKVLSEKDQAFVRMFYLESRSPEQIAQAMSISVKTVYSKKHKLHGRLQLALGRSLAELGASR
jgi:RNA polymerase sigma-70 factor (ECF subfamily)